MKSVFTDKEQLPNDDNLNQSLGHTYPFWLLIKEYVLSTDPISNEEWAYSKYGWSYRIKDKRRVIIYLLPRDCYFRVAFVFGQKATNVIMQSEISNAIKSELDSAKVYAEGRGIRISIENDDLIEDIIKLIDIKMSY